MRVAVVLALLVASGVAHAEQKPEHLFLRITASPSYRFAAHDHFVAGDLHFAIGVETPRIFIAGTVGADGGSTIYTLPGGRVELGMMVGGRLGQRLRLAGELHTGGLIYHRHTSSEPLSVFLAGARLDLSAELLRRETWAVDLVLAPGFDVLFAGNGYVSPTARAGLALRFW